MNDAPPSPAERLRIAFDLFDLGEKLMEQRLRRLHPDAGKEKIQAMLRRWLETRPGAEHGDACGRPRPTGAPRS